METISLPQLKPLYESELHHDFRDFLLTIGQKYGEKTAFIIKTKKARKNSPAEYKKISYRTFQEEAVSLGAGLYERGLYGKKIALLGINRYEWVLSYFAVLMGLGIVVPLDKGLPFEETKSSLLRSGADVLIFDRKHLEDVKKLSEDPELSIDFICMDDVEGFPCLSSIMEEGKEALQSGKTAYTNLPIDPDACSILIFTSGTSSLAKAVMLSQSNVLFDVHAMEQVEDIKYPDVCMAFLPFHHAYGIGGQLIMLSVGATTTFCDGLKYIQKNMVEYHVSTFIGVPILIEAIWKKILNGIEKQGAMKKFRRGIKLSNFLLKLGIDRRRKLFSDIYDQLGGSIHAVFSGASALDPECQQGFEDIGIHVCQGYGMTEASPVITTEDANDRKAGSIGKALPGIELAIADPNSEGIGELICRSPNVMLGYYNNPEETSKALAGGWLHTGDLAKADKDGFVYITGRAKNVIVLKNGKNVYPEELETLIEKLPYVKENIVIGEPRHNDGNWKDLALVAKIVYDKDYFHTVQGITDTSEIEKYIRKDLDEINSGLPNYQRILRLRIQDTPMKKTTTGKVKRFEEGARKSF